MSHFNVVAGTDDHAYGQPNARSLAVSNPDLALDNADNHEYFAENTPTLPMGAPPAPPAPSASDLAVQYAGAVHVTWSAVAGASSYRVYRCTTTATSSCVQLAAPTTTVYTDNGAQPRTVYYYRVRACNSVGCSGYSAPNTGSARPRMNIVPILELLLLD